MRVFNAIMAAILVSHLFMDGVNDTFTSHDRWYAAFAVFAILMCLAPKED